MWYHFRYSTIFSFDSKNNAFKGQIKNKGENTKNSIKITPKKNGVDRKFGIQKIIKEEIAIYIND